jgi:ISPg3, transposase
VFSANYPQFGIRGSLFSQKSSNKSPLRGFVRVFTIENQAKNRKTFLVKLVGNATDLFCKLFLQRICVGNAQKGSNMKNRLIDAFHKIMLRKRGIIKTINDMLKNVAQIVHTCYRSLSNFIVNLLAGMAAYAFYDTQPSINMEFEIEGKLK